MAKQHLAGLRVAVLAADGFEQIELTLPRRKLLAQGAQVEIVSLRRGGIRGVNAIFPGVKVKADRTIFTARAERYDALLIPGGLMNPDLLRQSQRVLDFVREFDTEGKPIATLCHGPWVLISAGLVDGRRLTSWPGIRDDVVNAGGKWENKAVVRDGNWISSRGPQDLLQFNREMVRHFSPRMTAKDHRFPLPLAPVAVGGLALAAIGLGVRELNRRRRLSEIHLAPLTGEAEPALEPPMSAPVWTTRREPERTWGG